MFQGSIADKRKKSLKFRTCFAKMVSRLALYVTGMMAPYIGRGGLLFKISNFLKFSSLHVVPTYLSPRGLKSRRINSLATDLGQG